MTRTSKRPLVFPGFLQGRLEREYLQLLQPHGVPAADFAAPPGEAALAGPDSVSWQVFRNPVALFVGGVTAVILELAEPRVRSGVWDHTSFRSDPRERLQRTALAAMMTVYGARSRTEAMIGGITRMHARVQGATPAGQAYRADDPELLGWVQATAGFGFIEAYHAYVRPLAAEQHDRYYAEGREAARLYGAVEAPVSRREIDLLFHRMDAALEASPVIPEFLGIMRAAPLLPRPLAPLQTVLVKAAVDIVPPLLRERLGLGRPCALRPWQRRLVNRCGLLADRLLLRSAPPAQACRRLGLPEDYLHRRE